MRKRRRLLVAVLGLALVSTFFLPPVYWRVIGFLKREAFYDGRPTSWWEREIEARYLLIPVVSSNWSPPDDVSPVRATGEIYQGWVREEAPPWYELLIPGPLRVDPQELSPALTSHDPKELAVLLELLRSHDPKVRLLAIWELARLNIPVQFVWVAIREACEDPDAEVRTEARSVLPGIKSRIEQRLRLNSRPE